jgi:hypothetical protein
MEKRHVSNDDTHNSSNTQVQCSSQYQRSYDPIATGTYKLWVVLYLDLYSLRKLILGESIFLGSNGLVQGQEFLCC